MGIRAKFTLVILGIAVTVGIASYVMLNRSHGQLIEQEATRIAEIVTTQVVADRAEYSHNLVGKLKADGTGAARDSEDKAGYIQLPAQFVRNVALRVKEQAGGLYSYRLVSQWNINEDQGLKDDFDTWAWAELLEQDKAFQASNAGPGETGFQWKSVSRIEENDGRQVLRYMRADPASAKSCVTCHNAYEQKPEIIALRKTQGTGADKSWKLHQLMGGIRVDVPIDEVAATAAAGRNNLLMGMGGVFVIGFGAMFVLIARSIIRPVETSVREVTSFSGQIEAVVDCVRQQLLGAEDQVDACKEAKSGIAAPAAAGAGNATGALDEGTDQVDGTLANLSGIANKNAKTAEESAFHCSQLDDSFKELKSRLQRILGTAT